VSVCVSICLSVSLSLSLCESVALCLRQGSHDVAVDRSDVISRGVSDVGAKTDLDDSNSLWSEVKINKIADIEEALVTCVQSAHQRHARL